MPKRKIARKQLEIETTALDKDIAERLKKLENDPYSSLVKQCREEFKIAWDHQSAKKHQQLGRLKLLNNQKRTPEAVGDTTMQDIMQTVVASLYTDRLTTEWKGREEGDDDQAENLNHLAQYDYEQMKKDELDYDWIWDVCFAGRAIMTLEKYYRDPEKNIYLPVPAEIDPMIVLRDPRAVSLNGKGFESEGAARFWGRPVRMTKRAMEENENFLSVDFSNLKHESNLKPMDLMQDAHDQRNAAQNLQTEQNSRESMLNDNAEYDLMAWYTHWNYNGVVQKVKVWLANDLTTVVGIQPVKLERWRAVDRPLFPHSHDWDGTSLPDLTEDKQRARAVAINLGMRAMKSDLYPNYIYDSTRITNRNHLKAGYNKAIPVDGNTQGAMEPVRKSAPNLQLLNFVYDALDISAQKATGTPDIAQGMSSQKDRPLGETNLVASGADTRRSLSAKIFGWSEKDFWSGLWYLTYKENYADGGVDEKVIRIEGAFGAQWRTLRREDIITKRLDPDVMITSTVQSRAKQLEDRQSLGSFFGVILGDPATNKRYAYRKLGKLYGMHKDEVDRLLPPTIDERVAEYQNESLNLNKTVDVLPEDDHLVHLEIHSKAKDTPATRSHIKTHEKALMIKKTKPQLFPQDQTSMIGGQPNPNAQNMQGGQQMPARAGAVAPSQTTGGVGRMTQ